MNKIAQQIIDDITLDMLKTGSCNHYVTLELYEFYIKVRRRCMRGLFNSYDRLQNYYATYPKNVLESLLEQSSSNSIETKYGPIRIEITPQSFYYKLSIGIDDE